jgi:hypothetical protein
MSHHGVVNQQHHDRTDNCDNHAPDVQAGDARCSKQAKEKSADKSAYNAKRNIEPKALALPIDDLGSDEAGDQAEYDQLMILMEILRPWHWRLADAGQALSIASFAFTRSIVGFNTSLTVGIANTLSNS